MKFVLYGLCFIDFSFAIIQMLPMWKLCLRWSFYSNLYLLLCHQYFKIYHVLNRGFHINLIYDIGTFRAIKYIIYNILCLSNGVTK